MQLNERIHIDINGVLQGMFLQSVDTQNPVLLVLHGGPGSPEIAFTQDHPPDLMKYLPYAGGSNVAVASLIKKAYPQRV